jgi:predicted dehydrogenase
VTIRIATVGTAHWARAVHTSGLQAAPGFHLVGVWGRDQGKTQELARDRGVEAFASFEAMLAAVDAVSFAVPPDIQEDLALRAIHAGKHVLLEKPIATCANAATRMAEAAEAAGIATIVFFTRRFIPEISAFVERHAGGRWRTAQAELYGATFAPGSPYQGSRWRRTPGAGIWDIGPHALSMLVPLLGPVTTAHLLPPEGRFERFETLHEGGARATIRITLHADPAETCNAYRFDGPDGPVDAPDPAFDRLTTFAAAAAALRDRIHGHTIAHPCDIRLGAETTRILEQVSPWPTG